MPARIVQLSVCRERLLCLARSADNLIHLVLPTRHLAQLWWKHRVQVSTRFPIIIRMCELAIFHWSGDSVDNWDWVRLERMPDKTCPRVVPLLNDGDNPWEFRCDIQDFAAETARGNLYAFSANVSCTQYIDVSYVETINGTEYNYTRFNISDPVLGSFSVPTLGSLDGEGDGYGPGLLTNQTLWLDGWSCFQEAGEENYLDDTWQYCEEYEDNSAGLVQPLECCIGEIDVILASDMKKVAWIAAAMVGGILAGYFVCRCIIQTCAFFCCPRLCCVAGKKFHFFRAQSPATSPAAEGQRVTCQKVGTTMVRIGAVSLSLLGFGLNSLVSARYFSFRTIIIGVIYENVVGILEGFSAFWIGDGFSLNAITASNWKRSTGIVLCTLFLTAYLSSVGHDISTRQTCGFENAHVMFGVGTAIYVFVGVVGSMCGKSLGYAQQIFTDNLAAWPAIVTTFKCEPPIKIAVITGAVLLGWVGTTLVVIYGEAVSAVTG